MVGADGVRGAPTARTAGPGASVQGVVNATVRMLTALDGTPVCNAVFDLSADQLCAAAHAVEEVRVERHRGHPLGVDEALALQAMTSVVAELEQYVEAGGHGTLVLPLARMALLHDGLEEWVRSRDARGWLRDADTAALPVVRSLLAPLTELRAQAVRVTLEPAPSLED